MVAFGILAATALLFLLSSATGHGEHHIPDVTLP